MTEVRVILNKYFSSHFENFTAQEKEIIKSVNNYKMTNPDKYNKAMNQLLESNQYGLGNYDQKRMINNNINTSSENNMIDNMPKITDVNKSLEFSGMGGEDQK